MNTIFKQRDPLDELRLYRKFNGLDELRGVGNQLASLIDEGLASGTIVMDNGRVFIRADWEVVMAPVEQPQGTAFAFGSYKQEGE